MEIIAVHAPGGEEAEDGLELVLTRAELAVAGCAGPWVYDSNAEVSG
ncbi:MAG TPA: hypothetical protein VGM03_14635 [Phycisphaerae bacterium]|jgi:hypothetical protein